MRTQKTLKYTIIALATYLVMSCGQAASDHKHDQKPEVKHVEKPNAQDLSRTPQERKNQLFGPTEELPMDLGILSNLIAIKKTFNLDQYHSNGYFGQGLKIGIFDNGFAGLKHSVGSRLPSGLKVEKAFDPRMQNSSHGTKMAEIIYALSTGQAEFTDNRSGPELYLFNTNGFSNLQIAIDRAIELKLDMILYAQVWEFGGQFDGDGFINREIDRALDAGILWINASGNGGLSTYTGKINTKVGESIKFRGKDRLRLVVAQDNTPTKIVLSWSDFRDSKSYKTHMDLDLIVEDLNGERLFESRLSQAGDRESFPGYSAHARESLEMTLKQGVYFIGVQYVANKDLKKDETDLTHRFRITATGSGVTIPDGTPEDSLPIPADNPRVVAVGALDVDYSGRFEPQNRAVNRRLKPDLWLKSEVQFYDAKEADKNYQTQTFYGTSAASALAAGALAVYMSAWGPSDSGQLLSLCQKSLLHCNDFKLPELP